MQNPNAIALPAFIDVQEQIVETAAGGPWPILWFVQDYLAKDETTAPGVWAVLRESSKADECWTGSDGIRRCYSAYRGDYEYFLYRRDNCAGCGSVATAPAGEGLPEPARSHAYSRERGRRTDQASGRMLLAWDMDDQWAQAHAAPAYWIRVVVLNTGDDRFALRYPGSSGQPVEIVFKKGASLGQVNSWVEVEVLVQARFANGLDGLDLVLDCRGDGDERVHRVEVEPVTLIQGTVLSQEST